MTLKAWNSRFDPRVSKLKRFKVQDMRIEENQKNAPWNSFRDGFFAMEPKQRLVGVDQEVPEVTCVQKTQQLACLVIIQGGCSTCPLKQSHK